jgi:hypothetical protein
VDVMAVEEEAHEIMASLENEPFRVTGVTLCELAW